MGEKTRKNLPLNRKLTAINIMPPSPNPIITALNNIQLTPLQGS